MAPDADATADQHITDVSGTGVPIPGDDVDTDQILPAKFMKEVTFDNMADYLFYDARRDDDGDVQRPPAQPASTARRSRSSTPTSAAAPRGNTRRRR